jgi:hypothetical protein
MAGSPPNRSFTGLDRCSTVLLLEAFGATAAYDAVDP